jgi:hypothetical protein
MKYSILLILSLIVLSSCSSDKYLFWENGNWNLTIDPVDWYVTFPMGSFKLLNENVPPDSSFGYFNLYSGANNLQVEIIINKEREITSAEERRDKSWGKQKKLLPNMKDINLFSLRESYGYEFTVPGEYDTRKHYYVFLYKDGYSINFHLTQMPYDARRNDLFPHYMSSIEFRNKNKTSASAN